MNPESERVKSLVSLDLDNLPMERTLGVQWNVDQDHFTFNVVCKDKPLTKRGVLSNVSSIYDPLGVVGPYVLVAKLLLQEITRLKLGWDEMVPMELVDKWKEWENDLLYLSEVSVDRCFRCPRLGKLAAVELHNFCDASERGHAAVSYVRFVDTNGYVHCAFIMGKTRVNPLRMVTIPRLELSAAVLAVKLSQVIQVELEYEFTGIFYWTDSTSVLQYLQNESRRFHTFIANRVAKIQGATKPSQ